jgi:hypothetical protein
VTQRFPGVSAWDRNTKEFTVTLGSSPQSDTLILETDNGDNPPVEIEKFQVFYPATRMLFKARPQDELFLYYGHARVVPPRYDLGLVAGQLLTAEKAIATLGSEEQLKKPLWSEGRAAGKGGVLFWGILALVVAVLLIVIARLLPKSPPPA